MIIFKILGSPINQFEILIIFTNHAQQMHNTSHAETSPILSKINIIVFMSLIFD